MFKFFMCVMVIVIAGLLLIIAVPLLLIMFGALMGLAG